MASSLELNKVIAGILTAGIIASASGIVAGILYGPAEQHGEHAFSVAVSDEPSDVAEEAAVPFETLLASADPAAGEGLTRQCAACHSFEEGGPDKVGPHLWGVVGRDVAGVGSFSYSDAIQGVEGVWDYDKLNVYLKAPRDYVPGTAMSFAGIKDDQKRADLIAYLRTLSEDPVPLPEAAPVEESAGEVDTAAADGAEAAPAAAEAAAAEEAPAAEAAETETAEAAPATEEAPAAEAAETATAEAAPAAEEAPAAEGADGMVAMVAAADPAAGQKLFRQCAACHSVEEGGGNRVGPALWGVYDRDVATGEGFDYSPALQEIPGEWDVAKLDHYLANPKEFAPGNKMAFAGVRKEEHRAALIAYLHSLSASPVPLEGQ
jgi:cytochrome c2